jgi:hypothetical protein
LLFYNDNFPSAYYALSCIWETVANTLWSSAVSTLEGERDRDLDLDKTIGRLRIAEYQVNKLRRVLDGRLDKSNPVVFSKGSSAFTFKCGDREYRITIDVDTFETEDKSITRSIRNAIQSPAFIITSTLCLAIICLLALVSPHLTNPILGSFSDKELETLDNEYSLILDRCAILLNYDDRPNPRSFGALYSTCDKAVVQLEQFCEEYAMAVCEDERIELYLTGNKPRPWGVKYSSINY